MAGIADVVRHLQADEKASGGAVLTEMNRSWRNRHAFCLEPPHLQRYVQHLSGSSRLRSLGWLGHAGVEGLDRRDVPRAILRHFPAGYALQLHRLSNSSAQHICKSLSSEHELLEYVEGTGSRPLMNSGIEHSLQRMRGGHEEQADVMYPGAFLYAFLLVTLPSCIHNINKLS